MTCCDDFSRLSYVLRLFRGFAWFSVLKSDASRVSWIVFLEGGLVFG